MRRKLYELQNQRAAAINAAEAAINADNTAEYDAQMAVVANINTEITRIQNLITEQERRLDLVQPSEAETRDMVEDRVNELRNGRSINFTVDELRRGLRSVSNADGDGTAFGSTIVQPIGAGAQINDNLGACSLLDLVRVQNMDGMSGWEEPYAISDMADAEAAPGGISARTAHDPSFGISVIKPLEVTTTSYVDRNIARLSPADYYAKIQQMALRSLRNNICKLILKGDTLVSHVMYGMINGVNKANTSLVKTVNATVATGAGKVDVNLLDDLYFSYGDDLTVGGNGIIMLNKKDLKALGKLRGTNEKGRLYAVNPMPGDACRGTISDGGMIIPYLINGNLTEIEGKSQEAVGGADILTCVYGDPVNYLLGLFGDYTVRIDESYKAAERLYTVLGDAMVGGNVVAKDGFVVAKIPKAAS